MCGIIGFTGRLEAQKILTEGLAALEYRGYDSAGIAYFKDTGKISIRKTVGKVKDLLAICDDDNNSTCGIGHTRWATHGGVTNANAHPHKVGNVALIHNGIIENYHEIVNKFDLADSLVSETDTEVAAALINKLYDGDPKRLLKGCKGDHRFICILCNVQGSAGKDICYQKRKPDGCDIL